MRLQKYLSQAGVCSRRRAEELIKAGSFSVNGKTAELGMSVEEGDVVKYGDRLIELGSDKIYIALNKPVGYISSSSSAQGKTVLDLVDIKERVYPVGRLDKDSQGLTLLTNDGELTNKLTHPRYGSDKEYYIELNKPLDKRDVKLMEQGMRLAGKQLQPVKVLKVRGKTAHLILKEGINRQIRKMLGKLDYDILKLERVRIGKLELGRLKVGEWKKISIKDIS